MIGVLSFCRAVKKTCEPTFSKHPGAWVVQLFLTSCLGYNQQTKKIYLRYATDSITNLGSVEGFCGPQFSAWDSGQFEPNSHSGDACSLALNSGFFSLSPVDAYCPSVTTHPGNGEIKRKAKNKMIQKGRFLKVHKRCYKLNGMSESAKSNETMCMGCANFQEQHPFINFYWETRSCRAEAHKRLT